jgi:hypothetical protein
MPTETPAGPESFSVPRPLGLALVCQRLPVLFGDGAGPFALRLSEQWLRGEPGSGVGIVDPALEVGSARTRVQRRAPAPAAVAAGHSAAMASSPATVFGVRGVRRRHRWRRCFPGSRRPAPLLPPAGATAGRRRLELVPKIGGLLLECAVPILELLHLDRIEAELAS